jgi:Zn-dependent protease with chaperone function
MQPLLDVLHRAAQRAARRAAGSDPGFDPRLVRGSHVAAAGPEVDRVRRLCARLNRVRPGDPKEAVLLSDSPFAAVTRRGRWIYLRQGFAEQLTDNGLAFVLAHEMAHHDLGHLTPMFLAAGMLGNWQRIELAADREGVRLVRAAGFAPAAALEALDPDLLGEEPPDALAAWFPGLAAAVDRVRRTHPPLAERRQALLRWLAG